MADKFYWVTPKLARDESMVVTEYRITPRSIYRAPAAFQKVQAPPAIVQRPGGTVDVQGLELTTVADLFPEDEALHAGDHVFVFLVENEREPGIFRFCRGAFGVFEIDDGDVKGLTRHVREAREDPYWDALTFAGVIENRLKRKP